MSYKALSPAQVEQFIECGYVPLRQAFACQDALAVQDAIWERLAERGIHRSDPATWTEPVVHIKENYSGPVFEACMTPRFADAIEDLVGPGRWRYRGVPYGWGWWPVNFSRGADQPWTVPTKGWHWDGGHFRHTLNSPEQGVLALCIFSEIGSRGGATLFAEGSHHLVARFLSQQTEGLELTEAVRLCSQSHPWLAALTEAQSGFGLAEAGQTGPTETEVAEERISHFMNTTFEDDCGTRLRVVEGIASPGDVFLCHPFLYHSASQNHLRAPRFLCNRTAPLREPMCFERPDGDYSPVEISIRRALSQGA
jgi:hypothetical protein